MPLERNELFYTIALTHLPDIGSAICKNLIAYCGSAEAVFSSPKSKLKKIPMVGEVRAEAISQAQKNKTTLAIANKEMQFIEKHNIQALFFTDDGFPKRLLECEDGPILLFYKGNAYLNTNKVVSVVGTRNATEYGKEIARKIVSELASTNVTVLSGMAYGIDGVAHQAALDNNLPTVGVLAHGLNRIYPEKHKNLAKQMVENGGLLTEYTTQDKFHPANFPQRNRIVAGMSDAVIVIESDVKGGAVITANIANSYNRDVFAVPGKVGEKYSRGCNFLIKTFKANIIESASDLLTVMNWQEKNTGKKPPEKQLQLMLSEKERLIYDLLGESDKTVDALLASCNLNSGELSATLLEMEMNGLVVSLPGKRFKKASR